MLGEHSLMRMHEGKLSPTVARFPPPDLPPTGGRVRASGRHLGTWLLSIPPQPRERSLAIEIEPGGRIERHVLPRNGTEQSVIHHQFGWLTAALGAPRTPCP